MIIDKIDNKKYIIKLLNKQVNIYNKHEIEELTKNIIKKLKKIIKIKSLIILDIYQDINYGIIIILSEKSKYIKKEIEIKINIHTDTPFLYKIEYYNAINIKGNLYYYKKNFYLELENILEKDKYYNILEQSEIIYETSLDIINNSIKIKI